MKDKNELSDAINTIAAAVKEGNKENILKAARIIIKIAKEINKKIDNLKIKYHIFLKGNNI